MKRQNIRKALLIFSFLLFPITIFYLSPVVIIEGATKGIVTGSFILFTIQFVLSLFFGRFFCGYVCPGGGLQECLMLVNSNKAKGGKGNIVKIVIWLFWLAAIIFIFVKSGGIKGVNPLFMTNNGISITSANEYIVYYGVVGVIIALALVFGKRGFCHYLCWMAPFMIVGKKISGFLNLPSLKLEVKEDNCISCSRCDKACPMSLEVNEMVLNGEIKNSECILCGECIDTCPKKVIKYSFGVNKRSKV